MFIKREGLQRTLHAWLRIVNKRKIKITLYKENLKNVRSSKGVCLIVLECYCVNVIVLMR